MTEATINEVRRNVLAAAPRHLPIAFVIHSAHNMLGAQPRDKTLIENDPIRTGVKIIIIAEMAVFNVAGYLIEERHRSPVITASPRGQHSK